MYYVFTTTECNLFNCCNHVWRAQMLLWLPKHYCEHVHRPGSADINYTEGILWKDNQCAVNADDLWASVPGAGGRLNKKDGLTRYGNSHVKDKTS